MRSAATCGSSCSQTRMTVHPSCVELPVVAPVTLYVRCELPLPPVSAAAGNRSVFGTGVPETAVDEHCHSLSRKHDVRSGPSHPRNRSKIDHVPQPKARSGLDTRRVCPNATAAATGTPPTSRGDPRRCMRPAFRGGVDAAPGLRPRQPPPTRRSTSRLRIRPETV